MFLYSMVVAALRPNKAENILALRHLYAEKRKARQTYSDQIQDPNFLLGTLVNTLIERHDLPEEYHMETADVLSNTVPHQPWMLLNLGALDELAGRWFSERNRVDSKSGFYRLTTATKSVLWNSD